MPVLPDPGIDRTAGAVCWRLLPEAEPLLEALHPLRYHTHAELPGMHPLKRGKRAFWARLEVEGETYFVKGREAIRLRPLLRSIFRPAPLRVEWRKTWWVREQGIPTIEPVAVGELRRWRALKEEFFICRWVQAPTLGDFLKEAEERRPPAAFTRLIRKLSHQAGYTFGRFHHRGAVHRQFHDLNLLVREGPTEPELLPIDFHHLTIGPVSEADRAWNFYQLAWYLRRPWQRHPQVDARAGLAFLRGYTQATGRDVREVWEWLRPFWPGRPLETKPYREDFSGSPGRETTP